jgi:predicted ArsR family transcriptional regulator
MPIVTTRHKILQFLVRNRTATAREVARALQMTTANARHHLKLLAVDGRIEVFNEQKGNRGRPLKVYRPSGKMLGNNLEMLLRALLEQIPTEKRESVLERIGQTGVVLPTEIIAPKNHALMQRLVTAIAGMNETHYQARWEAGGEGPRVILGHCPYEAIIDSYPELCRMDRSLLERLLGASVSQKAKLEKGQSGSTYCIFLVK